MCFSCTSSENTLGCLREADVSALAAANEKINAGSFDTFTFVPVVDGKFIRRRPTRALRAGKLNGVSPQIFSSQTEHSDQQLLDNIQDALLAVHNTNEGVLLVNQTAPPLTASEYVAQLFPKLRSQEIAAVTELYAGLGSDVAQENLVMREGLSILLLRDKGGQLRPTHGL